MPTNLFWVLLLVLSSLFSACESQVDLTKKNACSPHGFVKQYWQSIEHAKANKSLILLDPHGESEKVLKQYALVAKRHNCSLFSSPFIFNGMTEAAVFTIIDSLVDYINQQSPTGEIILAGFSGGAKYAQIYTQKHGSITRLILCGAISNDLSPSIPTLVFCGERDMNFAAMCQMQGKSCYKLKWPGKHAWPDEKTFESAFEDEKQWTEKHAKALINVNATTTKEINLELQVQKSYSDQFGSFTDTDWERILDYLSDDQHNAASARSKGLLSMLCYLYTDHFLKTGMLDQASKYCNRYLQVDPTNSDAYYFKALIAIRMGQREAAKSDFEQAVKLGWHPTADRKKAIELDF